MLKIKYINARTKKKSKKFIKVINLKDFKSILYLLFYVFSLIFIVPYSINFTNSVFGLNNLKNNTSDSLDVINSDADSDSNSDSIDIINNIDINNNNNFDTLNSDNLNNLNNFEYYILGVVGAEMPISFHVEALKAQAIAARTYAYKRIDDINQVVDHASIGQAYDSIETLRSKWGSNFDEYYNKLYLAISETQGVIMTYENEPIEAVFHSTSAGITELSENIWGKNLPYITHVDSSVDEQAPNFIYTINIPNDILIEKISNEYPEVNKNNIISSFEILDRSDADYILNIMIDNIKISGRDIRSILGLRSTNFSIIKNDDSISFTTKGYGHGAGMSQYGANFMAEDGSSYKEILNHYYSGIILEKIY